MLSNFVSTKKPRFRLLLAAFLTLAITLSTITFAVHAQAQDMELINGTIDTVDQYGNHIDGTFSIYEGDKGSTPYTSTWVNGAKIRIDGGAYDRWVSHWYQGYGYIGLCEDTTVFIDATGSNVIVSSESSPGINAVKFVFQSFINIIPVADAGENIAISSEEIAITMIQGIVTDEDPDDILEYRWIEGETILLDWTPAGENGECPLDLSPLSIGIGIHTLTLEVTDGQATSSDEIILTIENSAPNSGPKGGGVYEINTNVILGGNISDFDGDLLEYQWIDGTEELFSGSIQTIVGGDPVELANHGILTLSLGIHTIILQVSDGINALVSSEITVEIIDTGDPTLAPVADRTIIWPPNHEMINITIEANASDNSGLPVTLTAEIISNEPINGLGDGDMTPDWTNPAIDQEMGIINLQFRAERSGSGNGRVYTITITAIDQSDNSSIADVEIIVPHDKRKK